MAAPIGNQNARRAGIWRNALTRAIAKAGEGQGFDLGVERLAWNLVKAGLEGEQWALKEIGERLDGKSAQSITVAGEEDGAPIKHSLVVAYVSANPAPTET